MHDHVLFRQGLRRLLEDEPDIDVVSEAANAAECLRKVGEFQPDVLVADASLFSLSTSDVELRVSRESPGTTTVFLSTQEQADSHFNFRTVNGDCAMRQTSAQELAEMVRNACSTYPTDDTETKAGKTSTSSTTIFPHQHPLTAREQEVLKLLAEGKTVRAAATVLGLSSKTVDAHKFNLMRKIGIHNKAELVMWAIQKKVVKVPVNF